MVDPITQQATNILDNFVPLRVLEGEDKDDLLRQQIDLDKQAERELLKARVNSARGVGVENYEYDATDAIKKLLPCSSQLTNNSQASGKEGANGSTVHETRILCCLMGAPASGKSVLMKKCTVLCSTTPFDWSTQTGGYGNTFVVKTNTRPTILTNRYPKP